MRKGPNKGSYPHVLKKIMYSRGAHIFKKSRSNLQSFGTKRVM